MRFPDDKENKEEDENKNINVNENKAMTISSLQKWSSTTQWSVSQLARCELRSPLSNHNYSHDIKLARG